MKLLNHLLEMFGWRRRKLLGAVEHPNNLMDYIQVVRAAAFLKITGKSLVAPNLPSKSNSESLTGKLSPSRRLARRQLE